MDALSNKTYTIVVVLVVVLIIMMGFLTYSIASKIQVSEKNVTIENDIGDQIEMISHTGLDEMFKNVSSDTSLLSPESAPGNVSLDDYSTDLQSLNSFETNNKKNETSSNSNQNNTNNKTNKTNTTTNKTNTSTSTNTNTINKTNTTNNNKRI